MSEATVVAVLYTETEALEVCRGLDAAGVHVIYEPPAHAGNYILDWNLSNTEFRVSVPNDQVEAAYTYLDSLATNEDDVAVAEYAEFVEEAERAEEQRASERSAPTSRLQERKNRKAKEDDSESSEIKSILNCIILSWFLLPLLPYGMWRLIRASGTAISAKDKNRYALACLFVILHLPAWLMLLMIAVSFGG